MSLVGIAVAALLLLWPRGRAENRCLHLDEGAVPRAGSFPALLVAALVGAGLLLWSGVAALIAGGVVALSIRHRLNVRRRERDDAEAIDLLLDSLGVMVAELAVGAHPAHACRQAADDVVAGRGESSVHGAVAQMLTRMAGRAELGGDVAEGIESAQAPQQSSWNRVAVAWRTAEQHGLPMADLLDAVRADLLARRRFSDRTRAALAGARATAAVLAALPLLGVGLGQAMGAAPVSVLVSPGLGGILLVIGTALVATGLWWTERITAKVATP
ncbi:type II secretion system F family protein [Williamsia sp. CHRR-6]|nr:type II secretion system F family protein [Williamsia sp. CHRR-6]